MSVIWGVSKVEKKVTKPSAFPKEKIILGLDPGTNVMGYGLILIRGSKMDIIQFGVIQLNSYETHESRLKKIFDRVLALVEEFKPDEVALEAPFYGKNIQSMLKLGRGAGRCHVGGTLQGHPHYRIRTEESEAVCYRKRKCIQRASRKNADADF